MKTDKNRLHKIVNNLVKDLDLEYTNPQVQRNIEEYGVFVDNILIKKRLEWVYPEQSINIDHWPKRDSGNFEQIKILEEAEDYLVIFKPSNVVVQPGAGHKKDNLVTWLINNYPEQKEMLENSDEQSNAKNTAGLAHRLDKDTQGILLVARTLDNLDYFQNQFRNRETKKKYLAIVDGVIEKNYNIKNWQSRDKQNPIKQKFFWTEKEALEYDEKSRHAESTIQPLAICHDTNQTLIEIQIKTGRMHQIRVQAEALGFPLSNDKIYNKKIANTIKSDTDNCHIFFPAKEPKELTQDAFKKLQKEIFGDGEYCLLSNYMNIQTKSEELVEIKYFDTNKIDIT